VANNPGTMDKILKLEEAEAFLRELGFTLQESVIRTVVLVLLGKRPESKYDLHRHGRNKRGVERKPICGKGTVEKIEKLQKGGKLGPYIAWLDVEGGANNLEQTSENTDIDASAIRLQPDPVAKDYETLDRHACPYERPLRGLIGKWLDISQAFNLTWWMTVIDERMLSSAALLDSSRNSLQFQRDEEARNREGPVLPEGQNAWWEQHPENLWLPAPFDIAQSPLFPFLAEHLEGDSIWEDWKSAYPVITELRSEAWAAAHELAWGLVGFLANSGSEEIAGHEQIFQRIGNDTGYRDSLSGSLKRAFRLAGGQLVYKGLSEEEFAAKGTWARRIIGQYLVELNDEIQRTETVFPSLLEPDLVKGQVDQIWEGKVGQDEYIVETLGRDSILRLIKRWYVWVAIQQSTGLRLTTLINQETLPGLCGGCRDHIS